MRPDVLPTKTRPPTMVGCTAADVSPAKPKAHFSFRFGTVAAVSVPPGCDWKRSLRGVVLQPFHALAGVARNAAGALAQRGAVTGAAIVPSGLPVRNTA